MSKSTEILRLYLPVLDDWCGNYNVSNMHYTVDSVVCVTLTQVAGMFIVRASGTDDMSYVARFENKEMALACTFNLVKVQNFTSAGAMCCGLLPD